MATALASPPGAKPATLGPTNDRARHVSFCAVGGRENKSRHIIFKPAFAACHCTAKNYESTDWQRILALYDRLVEFDNSPVVALNRAVALAKVRGPQAGIEAVRAIQNLQSLESYYLLYAVLGEFESRLDHSDAAAAHFRKSLQLAEIKSEQAFLSKRLQACQTKCKPRRIDESKPANQTRRRRWPNLRNFSEFQLRPGQLNWLFVRDCNHFVGTVAMVCRMRLAIL